MKKKPSPSSRAQARQDYSRNMFRDGHNRTETNEKAHDAPDYDRAAHQLDRD